LDIKQRVGTVGDTKARLAVMLGPLCFDQSDAETTRYIELAFDLALETDLAVGFHVDDSMFWRSRRDLWSDPQNVEALDWDGTPCRSRRLDWSKEPSEAPPQMCFNSKAIQREVQQRSALIGKAIQAGRKKLQERNKPELFAGVIVGWETMIGQDFETGKYLGYRALVNRGFSREQPPKNVDFEREQVVQEFIELWTTGIAEAGVSPQKIYSHTAFLSRRAFKKGDDKDITYMKSDKGDSYSQHNHFAPPSVAFGKNHRPGFSTYPQPGLFEDIYELVEKHEQVGWASCEGTNMQPGTGPGQTGMNMETYLAKMFNHGATLTTVFSWGIGGEAMKNMSYRVCTESEEALQAYRKFLRGETLIEGMTVAGLMERLPPKVHRIQKDLPAWLGTAGADNKQKAVALMQKLQERYKAKKFDEVEKMADAVLKLMDTSAPTTAGVSAASARQDISGESLKRLRHDLGGSFIVSRDKVQEALKLTTEQKEKLQQHLGEVVPDAMQLFQKIQGLKPDDRKKELRAYRPKAQEKLATLLKGILSEGQCTRLRQLELQREGLRNGEIWKDLQVTDEQRTQFMALMQQAQKETQLLLEKLKNGSAGKEEIQPKVIKVREDLEGKLEALLTDAQKKQWQEMLGKPMDLAALFDL
jgi:Spy/CpxP family protein refolding chaperone